MEHFDTELKVKPKKKGKKERKKEKKRNTVSSYRKLDLKTFLIFFGFLNDSSKLADFIENPHTKSMWSHSEVVVPGPQLLVE